MKKIISAILVATMVIACFAMTTNAAVIHEMGSEDLKQNQAHIGSVVSYEYADDVLKIDFAVTFTYRKNLMDAASCCGNDFEYYTVDGLTYKNGYMKTVDNGGEPQDGTQWNDANLIGDDDGIAYWTFISFGREMVAGDVCTVTFTFEFDVDPSLAGETISVYNYFYYCVAGGTNIEYDGDYEFALVEEAAEDTHTAPATPVAATKDACEACGTAAGVRFLMTVDKTAADFADVTAYGVVIETADGEYKYTADANTKKAETATAIEYAVVVTGAPAGTTFTATAFLVYNDNCEVAGISGELTA